MADNESRAGRTYATPEILDWLADTHGAIEEHDRDGGALGDAARADVLHGLPAIQIGPAEGQTIGLLLRLAGARRVVEIGTLAGYSAIWMARALPEGGTVVTLENEASHAAVARQNVARAGVADRVRVLEGDALESLAALESSGEGSFCAVFVDADKGRYDQYAEWAVRFLRPGGLLIGDNAFFFGDLLSEEKPAAASMRRFHEILAKHFISTCIPTPDGLAVGILQAPAA